MDKRQNHFQTLVRNLLVPILYLLSVVLVVVSAFCCGRPQQSPGSISRITLGEEFSKAYDVSMSDASAPETVEVPQELHYTIPREGVAPKPNLDCWGSVSSPEEMKPILSSAQDLLEGQSLYFSGVSEVLSEFGIRYYLDETIFTVTWKQIIDHSMYTFTEVKIADASQFRRYFAGGAYGSGKLVYPTEMSNAVNAVVASSGDYYAFRRAGNIVYNGVVCRTAVGADTCYVDANGDLLFTRSAASMTEQQVADFVQENHIQFSLAFGPVLVENGELCEFGGYGLGEIGDQYSRAALCQMDQLHYMIVNANLEGNDTWNLTMYSFARHIAETGCQSAYGLDGGQTAAHMVNGVLVNQVARGYQRKISDIIYFATAVPNS